MVDTTATVEKVERADITAAFLTAVREERDRRADITVSTKKDVKLFVKTLLYHPVIHQHYVLDTTVAQNHNVIHHPIAPALSWVFAVLSHQHHLHVTQVLLVCHISMEAI